jgi:cytoskeletal protein RodZ
MDVGTELRNGRERRGISLSVLAASTKIGVATLTAMERGDFARLPGGIFTRGFLRAYAREVGLDPEETVQHYLAQFEPPPSVEPAVPAVQPEPAHVSAAEMEELEERTQRKQLVGGVVAFLIGSLSYFTFVGRHPAATSSVAAQAQPTVTPATAEVGTSGSPGAPPSASDTYGPAGVLHLEIRPTEACWVSATADGRQRLQRLMTAGEHETVDAADEVILRIGDASTCAFSINGRVARPAGKAGQPATLHITRQNYKDFLDSASPAAAAAASARPTTMLAVNASSAVASDPLSTPHQR